LTALSSFLCKSNKKIRRDSARNYCLNIDEAPTITATTAESVNSVGQTHFRLKPNRKFYSNRHFDDL